MSDEEDDNILPEDDSIFEHLDAEGALHELSTESILDDSFSSVVASTPAGRGVPPPRPARGGRAKRPLAIPLSPRPPNQVESVSPRRQSTRIHARGATPEPASPRPVTRSVRSQARGATPEPASPRPTTRSVTRSASPSVSSPRPTTRSQTAALTPERSSPRPNTRSQTRGASPNVPSPRSGSHTTGSTPERTQASGISGVRQLPAPEPRFPAKLKCPLCPSLLANETTLATHKKRHALKRAFARAASREEFLAEIPVLAVHALEKMVQEPLIGTLATSVNKFAQVVLETMKSRDEFHSELFEYLCDQLYNLLKAQDSIFGSSLQYVLLVGVNKLLNSVEFREELRGYILGLSLAEPPDSVGTLNVFLSNFFIQLSYKAIVYYIKKIHGFSATQEIRKKRSDDQLDSVTFLQMCYHIGGSVASGYLYKGSKYKASPWKAFVVVLRTKILRVQAIGNACADEVREFTESKDRGGLKHISQEALDFFVVLFDLLMSLEGVDGSLPENVIDDHVLPNTTVLCLWDILVGSDLDEDSSMDFLERVARTCRNCVIKGIMKRKMNDHLKKAVSSINLRSRLA